jgi:putative transposase
MVDHPPVPRGSPSVARQCQLLDVSRSSLYYQPKGISEEDDVLMRLIDRQYLAAPFYGARKIAAWLKSQQRTVNRKRVRRLMRVMGIKAIYRRPRTSKPAVGNKIYPYLLNGLPITRTNQVWAADITYIPMARGFLYLVVIMDWYSRYVLAWRLSNTLDVDFCVEALQEALRKGRPEIFKPTRALSSLVMHLPVSWNDTESGSAWTGKTATTITCSSSGCGGV